MIGIGIINGVSNKKISTSELLFVNCLIVVLTALLELPARARRHVSTPMLYDNLELLRPERHDALIADLVARTGLEVVRVQVHRVDFLRDAARSPSSTAARAPRRQRSKRRRPPVLQRSYPLALVIALLGACADDDPVTGPGEDLPLFRRVALLKELGLRQEALLEIKRAVGTLRGQREIILFGEKLRELGEYRNTIAIATRVPYSDEIHGAIRP